MQSSQYQHQKISFNNGKTFYVPLQTQITESQPLSLFKSQVSTQFHPIIRQCSTPNEVFQRNTQYLYQNTPLIINSQRIVVNYHQQNFNNSQREGKTIRNLKSSQFSKQSTSPRETQRIRLIKKNKIFDSTNLEGRRIEYNQVGSINNNDFHSRNTARRQKNEKATSKQGQCTTPSKTISFARNCPTSERQQIASYSKIQKSNPRVFSSNCKIEDFDRRRKLSANKVYNRFTSTSLESFNKFPRSYNKIDQNPFKFGESPSIMAAQGKQHEQLPSSNRKNTMQLINKMKISTKIEKQTISRENLHNFYEQSTVKTKHLHVDKAEQHHISVSNIEQDNSFSRYFDSKDDDFLPLLNRISYQYIDIEKKSEVSEETIRPNIFMDFDKVTSPGLKRRQTREIVHFDCTIQSQKYEKVQVQNPPKEKKQSIPRTYLPLSLILITFILLLIQTFS